MHDDDRAYWPLSGVRVTDEARLWLHRLRHLHGPLIFHQSHGCCDGSAPILMRADEFRLGAQDELLARVDGVRWYIHRSALDQWSGQELVLTVTRRGGGGFSLEVAEGIRFLALTERGADEKGPASTCEAGPLGCSACPTDQRAAPAVAPAVSSSTIQSSP